MIHLPKNDLHNDLWIRASAIQAMERFQEDGGRGFYFITLIGGGKFTITDEEFPTILEGLGIQSI